MKRDSKWEATNETVYTEAYERTIGPFTIYLMHGDVCWRGCLCVEGEWVADVLAHLRAGESAARAKAMAEANTERLRTLMREWEGDA